MCKDVQRPDFLVTLKRVSHQNKTQDSKIPFLQNCREVNQIKKSI